MNWFDRDRTSALQWARSNDEEMAEREIELRAAEGDKPGKKQQTIETFEWSPTVELLAQLFPLTQQLIHAVHTHQTRAARRKPKITTYPTPTTALKRARGNAKRSAFATVESLITFSDEPYAPDSGLVRYSRQPPPDETSAKQNRPKPNQLRPRPAPTERPDEEAAPYLTGADREWLGQHGWEPPPS